MQKKNISRRNFIRNTGLAAAGAIGFPYIIPSSALGADGHVAPSNRITMGAIGVGGQGTYNLKQFLGIPEVQVVAVCEADKNRLAAAKELVNKTYDSNGCADYGDFRDLFARDDIDTALVCTPDFWHGVITVAAAKAGKDIYCEKPLVNTIEEGIAVRNAVKQYGRVLQTGSHERSRHNARYACELVRNKRIGELKAIHVNLPWDDRDLSAKATPMPVPPELDYDMWLGPTPWVEYTEKRCHFWFRYILEYSGGEVTDRGAHIIDLGQLGHGSDDTGPVEIRGKGHFIRDGLFDIADVYDFEFTYADGVKMFCSNKQPRGIKFEGTDGWVFIHIHGGNLRAEPASLLTSVIGADEIHLGRSPGHHQDFINNVKTRGTCMASVEVGHRTATMCHLANIAMLTGRTIKWDPEKEQIIGDDEANKMLARPMRAPWTLT